MQSQPWGFVLRAAAFGVQVYGTSIDGIYRSAAEVIPSHQNLRRPTGEVRKSRHAEMPSTLHRNQRQRLSNRAAEVSEVRPLHENVKRPTGKVRKLGRTAMPSISLTNQRPRLSDGRVIVSRDALLQWLQSKLVKQAQRRPARM